MDVVPLWQKFKQLGQLDTDIVGAHDAADALQAERSLLQSQSALHRQALSALKHTSLSFNQQLKEQEALVSSLDKEINRKKLLLEQAENAKQESALRHEVELLQSQLRTAEDVCFRLMEQSQQAHDAAISQTPMLEAALETIETRLPVIEQELKNLTARLQKSTEYHEQLVASISDEWLKKYQTLKARISDPLVPAINQCCGGCFYLILSQDFTRLKNSGILHCRNCFRLLYYDSE